MKEMFIFLILSILTLSLFGQQEYVEVPPKKRKNQLGFHIGYSTEYMKGGHISPLHYSGSSFGASLEYIRRKSKSSNIFSIRLAGSLGKITNDASDYFDIQSIIGEVHVDYLIRLNKMDEQVEMYFGPAYKYDALVFIHDEFAVPGVTFIGAHNFNLMGQLGLNLNDKHTLQTRLAVPVFASVIRPPYNVFDEFFYERTAWQILTKGKIKTWNKYQAMDFSADYIIGLSRRFDFKLSYELRLKRMKDVETFVHGDHQVRGGFNLKF